MTLKVMTYNIKRGGRPDRHDAIIGVIADQRPDLVALQELRGPREGLARTAGQGREPSGYGRQGGPLLREMASRLGMRPLLGRSLFGQPVALLTRESVPVRDGAAIRMPFHHAAVRLVVETTSGPLTVFAAHLYPASGGRRLREAQWLSARVDRTGLALLLGDLNGLDPHTSHAERLAELSPADRARHLRRDGTVDTRAIEALESAGLVDVFRRVGSGRDYTAPSELPGGSEFSRLRLDYVLASPALTETARSCHVVDGGAAATASDHYPVVAEFDVALATFDTGTREGTSPP